ncbi:unnamed protein product [marine sediment metagenome]|uniref:Uncharacterized protein n=1 Tax=marine sediment metagenome TaxID=412755 RepID=X1ULZ5_9ZZZZ
MEVDRFNHIIKYLDFDVLDDWESGFVESCESYFMSMGELSPKMTDKLEQIFRKQNES